MAYSAYGSPTVPEFGGSQTGPDDENKKKAPTAQAGAPSAPPPPTAHPYTPPQTFAQMQQSGQARPAPPQPQQNPLQQQTGAAISRQLANPSSYGTPEVQASFDRLSRNIDDDFTQRQRSTDETMARRGLFDSSKAAGALSDLNVGRRSARENLAETLLDQQAQRGSQDRANAISQAMGYTGQLAGQDLARQGLEQSGSQFDRQLAQSGQQFGSQMGYNYASLNNQSQLGNRGLDVSERNAYNGQQAQWAALMASLGYAPGSYGSGTGANGSYTDVPGANGQVTRQWGGSQTPSYTQAPQYGVGQGGYQGQPSQFQPQVGGGGGGDPRTGMSYGSQMVGNAPILDSPAPWRGMYGTQQGQTQVNPMTGEPLPLNDQAPREGGYGWNDNAGTWDANEYTQAAPVEGQNRNYADNFTPGMGTEQNHTQVFRNGQWVDAGEVDPSAWNYGSVRR